MKKRLVQHSFKERKFSFAPVLWIIGLIVLLVVVLLVFGSPTLKGQATAKPQCNDGKDNDADGKIDLKDLGCKSRKDNDESNCGDGVCTPGVETSANCVQDCGPANSCSDSDGGIKIGIAGIVSGYFNKLYYSKADYCIDAVNLNEYFCNVDLSTSVTASCITNATNTCSNGACVYVAPSTTTTTLPPTTTTTTLPITTTTLPSTTTTLPSTTTTLLNATTTTLSTTTTTLPATTTTTLMNVTTTTLSTTTTTVPGGSCSATWDGICPSTCSAGSDYDCCVQAGYCWRPGQGCYTTC